MKPLKFKIAVIKSRFLGLRREILFFGVLTLFSIILIELVLNKINALNQVMYDLGQVYLRLCYSYFSAFIFYLLIVHFPRERRRVKSFRFTANKAGTLYSETLTLFRALFKEKGTEIGSLSRKQIEELCKNINPNVPIYVKGVFSNTPVLFPNHYVYLNSQTQKMKATIDSLLALGDIIDNDLIYCLTCIDDTLTTHLTFDVVNIPATNDFNHISYWLSELIYEIVELNTKFKTNYKMKYEFEYHHYERKRNRHKR